MNSNRTLMRYAREALIELGLLIKLGRKHRKMSEADFADRLGVTRRTLQRIEKGDPKVAIGTVFEAAHVAGIKLFEQDKQFATLIGRTDERLALLPKRIRKSKVKVHDAF